MSAATGRASSVRMAPVERGLLAVALAGALAAVSVVAVGARADRITRPRGVPATPAGEQIAGVLAQLNGRARLLEVGEVRRRFAPAFLAQVPARTIRDQLARDAARAPVTFRSLVGRPTPTHAIALVETAAGERVALYVIAEGTGARRIVSLEITDPPPFPPASAVADPGPYTGAFDVGGRRLFLTCSGGGSPTVVLESGAGGGAAAWARVLRPLAALTRVCSYDRANVPGGASDPAPKPRTARDVVADLQRLLTVAGVPGPFVLVGHSNGGIFARLYAATHPSEVAGLVLVDSASEELADVLRERSSPAELEGQERAAREAARRPFVERLSEEQVDVEASIAQLRAARGAGALPAVPLVVVAHGLAPEPAAGESAARVAAREQAWRESQERLAGLLPGGRLVVAERSGHEVPQEQPEVVVDAVRAVVEAARR